MGLFPRNHGDFSHTLGLKKKGDKQYSLSIPMNKQLEDTSIFSTIYFCISPSVKKEVEMFSIFLYIFMSTSVIIQDSMILFSFIHLEFMTLLKDASEITPSFSVFQ